VLVEDLGAAAIRAWLGIDSERPAPRSGGHVLHAAGPERLDFAVKAKGGGALAPPPC